MGRRKLVSDGQVLERALAVLADGGGEGFTLVRVAEAAGVAASTVIQRFRSRAELLVAAFAYVNAWLRPWLDERQDATSLRCWVNSPQVSANRSALETISPFCGKASPAPTSRRWQEAG